MPHYSGARQRAIDAKNALQARLASLDDPRLRDDHKQRVSAHAYLKARAQVAEAYAAHLTEVAATRRSLEQRAFAFPDDPDGFRTAFGTVERLTTRGELAGALHRGERTADPVLSHAAYVRAHELGFDGIVGEYTRAHPDRGAALQNLATFDAEGDDEAPFSELRPPILPPGLPRDDGHLERLAAQSGEPPLRQSTHPSDIVLHA